LSLSVRSLELDLISEIADTDSDTQGFVAKYSDFGILVFRGTYNSRQDILTDAKARLVNGRHEGIFTAFSSVESKVSDALNKLGNLPIYACGHSLGGALAKAAILQLPNRRWAGCYTFGSPPICDANVPANNQVPTYLVVNEGDVVSRIMDLHDVPELNGIYDAIESALIFIKDQLEKGGHESASLAQALEYVKSARADLQNYCHFGELRIYNNEGMELTQEESMSAFRRVFRTNPMRALDDHKISRYISNLEKFRDRKFFEEGTQVIDPSSHQGT